MNARMKELAFGLVLVAVVSSTCFAAALSDAAVNIEASGTTATVRESAFTFPPGGSSASVGSFTKPGTGIKGSDIAIAPNGDIVVGLLDTSNTLTVNSYDLAGNATATFNKTITGLDSNYTGFGMTYDNYNSDDQYLFAYSYQNGGTVNNSGHDWESWKADGTGAGTLSGTYRRNGSTWDKGGIDIFAQALWAPNHIVVMEAGWGKAIGGRRYNRTNPGGTDNGVSQGAVDFSQLPGSGQITGLGADVFIDGDGKERLMTSILMESSTTVEVQIWDYPEDRGASWWAAPITSWTDTVVAGQTSAGLGLTIVPEPATMLVLFVGLPLLGLRRRRAA